MGEVNILHTWSYSGFSSPLKIKAAKSDEPTNIQNLSNYLNLMLNISNLENLSNRPLLQIDQSLLSVTSFGSQKNSQYDTIITIFKLAKPYSSLNGPFIVGPMVG